MRALRRFPTETENASDKGIRKHSSFCHLILSLANVLLRLCEEQVPGLVVCDFIIHPAKPSNLACSISMTIQAETLGIVDDYSL